MAPTRRLSETCCRLPRGEVLRQSMVSTDAVPEVSFSRSALTSLWTYDDKLIIAQSFGLSSLTTHPRFTSGCNVIMSNDIQHTFGLDAQLRDPIWIIQVNVLWTVLGMFVVNRKPNTQLFRWSWVYQGTPFTNPWVVKRETSVDTVTTRTFVDWNKNDIQSYFRFRLNPCRY